MKPGGCKAVVIGVATIAPGKSPEGVADDDGCGGTRTVGEVGVDDGGIGAVGTAVVIGVVGAVAPV